MKNFIKLIAIFILSITIFSSFGTGITDASFFTGEDKQIYLCNGGDCGFDEGVELASSSVEGIVTDGNATDQIQKIIKYLLTFITLIAVVYIIYAGFRILTSSGEDEVIKNQKKTIGYIVVGILVIWFAWTIANFAVTIGTGGK